MKRRESDPTPASVTQRIEAGVQGRKSRGNPSPRSPMMLRWMFDAPPRDRRAERVEVVVHHPADLGGGVVDAVVLVIVQPETVVRWHKRRFRAYWRSISTPGPGRPPISNEIKALIVRMATENRWRAWKIHGELSKLGIHSSLSTISRYLPKATPDPDN